MRAFTYKHVICFEDTNVVGNVYFARHVAWQGACREMFLRTHCPTILTEIEGDLRLVTISVSCDYFEELHAFDEVRLNMTLAYLRGNRIGLHFDYRVEREGRMRQCAIGKQEIGCMRIGRSGVLETCEVPAALRDALEAFQNEPEAV